MDEHPYQMTNLAGDPDHTEPKKTIAERLKKELVKIGDYPFKSGTEYTAHLKRQTGIKNKKRKNNGATPKKNKKRKTKERQP